MKKTNSLKCVKCGLIIEGTHEECLQLAGIHSQKENHYEFKSKNGGNLGII